MDILRETVIVGNPDKLEEAKAAYLAGLDALVDAGLRRSYLGEDRIKGRLMWTSVWATPVDPQQVGVVQKLCVDFVGRLAEVLEGDREKTSGPLPLLTEPYEV